MPASVEAKILTTSQPRHSFALASSFSLTNPPTLVASSSRTLVDDFSAALTSNSSELGEHAIPLMPPF